MLGFIYSRILTIAAVVIHSPGTLHTGLNIGYEAEVKHLAGFGNIAVLSLDGNKKSEAKKVKAGRVLALGSGSRSIS
jgi:hypothetical protein